MRIKANEQVFNSYIKHIIQSRGHVSDRVIDGALMTFDKVEIPSENIDKYITLKLTEMDLAFSIDDTTSVWSMAKKIKEAMKDVNMWSVA